MKTMLTVSRNWNNPMIRTRINNELIALDMDIEDFKIALIQELGAFRYVTKARLTKAIDRIVKEIKQESIKTVR